MQLGAARTGANATRLTRCWRYHPESSLPVRATLILMYLDHFTLNVGERDHGQQGQVIFYACMRLRLVNSPQVGCHNLGNA